jgi:ring-1,2-phenylacetyl-CoA epoxidase subunit PaaD
VSELATQVGIARARSEVITGRRMPSPNVVDEALVLAALTEVMDPELPMLSVVDLGIIHRVDVGPAPGGSITVEILPTFVGCPALELIKSSIADRLAAFGRPVVVDATFDVPWTSDRITPEGRAALTAAGIAPPGEEAVRDAQPKLIDLVPPVPCPHCGSRRTIVENLFGPTQCRTIRYCTDCRQPFESIKTV